MRLRNAGLMLVTVVLSVSLHTACAPKPVPTPAPPPPAPPPFQEEERPPIIVQEGSFKFKLDQTVRPWAEKGNSGGRKWRINHVGKDVAAFSVAVTGKDCGAPRNGTRAVIYFDSGGGTRQFRVFVEPENPTKQEPIAMAPVQMTHDGAQLLTYGTAGNGNITRLDVDGTEVCRFDSRDTPSIKFTFK